LIRYECDRCGRSVHGADDLFRIRYESVNDGILVAGKNTSQLCIICVNTILRDVNTSLPQSDNKEAAK
jgi:hypothetical protein